MNGARLIRIVPATLAAVVVLALVAPGVNAQQYPPSAPTVTTTDSTVDEGQRVTVSGENWKRFTKVTILFRSRPITLGTARVHRNGTFSKRITIPDGVSNGRHFIVVRGVGRNGDRVRARTAVTVGGTNVVTPAIASAYTGGGSIQLWMVAALSLLGAGIVMLSAGFLLKRSRVWTR